MKVGFLSADWGTYKKDDGTKGLIPGGSGHYRVHLPAKYLSRNGVDTVVGEQVAVSDDGLVLLDWQTGEEHADCDIIVMQRIMFDFAIDLIEAAHANGQIIVNDVDDWYWGLHPNNNAYKATDPKYNPKCNRDHYKKALQASDLVITSTPFLRDRMEEFGCNSVVVRNAVDLEVWPEPEPQRERPVIGWVGSTSHRSGDLETLRGIVGPFVERHDLNFHHGGYGQGHQIAASLMGVDPKRSTQTPLCQIELYPQHFKFFDISLIPLNKIDFNEAKSFIKGIESAAAGKVFIAQDTAEYKFLQEEYGLGRVAKKPRDWIRNLDELLDYDLRVEEAERNRKLVEALDMAVRWTDWYDAITSTL